MSRTTTPEQQRVRLAAQLADLQQRRSRLGTQLAAAESGWAASLAAGEATDKHTDARRRLLAEIEDVDSELGRVGGWLAEVDAAIERTRREAAYDALVKRFEDAKASARASADRYVGDAWQVLQDTIAAATRVHEAYREAKRLHGEAEQLAQAVHNEAAYLFGQDVQPAVPNTLVEAHRDRFAEHSLAGRFHILRYFDATTKGAALTAAHLGEAASGEVGKR